MPTDEDKCKYCEQRGPDVCSKDSNLAQSMGQDEIRAECPLRSGIRSAEMSYNS